MSTFAELVTELQARGFFDDDATRAGVYVNQARSRLDGMHLWPYRESSGTGTAPMTVADLGVIEAVTNETQDYPLRAGDFRALGEEFGDLSLAGSPVFFYVAWVSGDPVVATYPTSADTVGVQYWRVTPDISGSMEPAAPARFHDVIVDLAVQRAYLDRDQVDQARALGGFVAERVGQMVGELLGGQQVVGPQERQALSYDACDW